MRQPLRLIRLGRQASLALPIWALLSLHGLAAEAEETSYADRAKGTIQHLMSARPFTAESGCDGTAKCDGLVAQLRSGAYSVIEPVEASDRPDMPTYLQARKKCAKLDPVHITMSHRKFTATRNFAMYRLDAARPSKKAEGILVFRAQDYLSEGDRHLQSTESDDDAAAPLPGTFFAFDPRNCRLLTVATAENGTHFAKHNEIAANDHVSELIKLDGRYFVVNLVPIAGPRQPKETWWYSLSLWDLGLPAAGGGTAHPHVYTFGYKPSKPADVALGDGVTKRY
ncbi:MAG TPA: hypothetical protein VET85_11195 [Stellaceae bacterium]|nr:hypothetical protein [Stellaceae bacterium]